MIGVMNVYYKPNETKYKYCKVQYGCGCIKERRLDHVRKAKIVKCLECYRGKIKNEPTIRIGCDSIIPRYWNSTKRNAKGRKLSFSITKEYAYSILTKQGFKCAVSGKAIVLANKNTEYENGGQTASMDRIDSHKGYVDGNIQWIHKKYQPMKMSLSQQDFIESCKDVAIHNS